MNRLRRRLAAALALLISCAACADVKIEGRGVPEAAAPAGLFAAPQPWTKHTDGNAEGSADYTCNTSTDDCHMLVVEPAERRL